MIALRLFWEFFKTGLFAVGGGLATLPFLIRMSAATGWFTTDDLTNLIAVSESTPGPLGVNMATHVGFKSVGIFGGVIATLGLIAPSIIVIILISKVLDKFRDSEAVQRIFYGLRPASTALIAAAGIGVAKIVFLHPDLYKETGSLLSLFDWRCMILAALLYIGLKKFKKHPIVYIAAAALAGIIFGL